MCPTRNGHYQVSTLETTHLTLTPSVFHRKPRYTPLNFSSMVPPHDAQIIQKRQQYMSCHIWTSFLWVKPLLLPCHVHGISLRYPCCIWDHNFVLLLKTFNPTQHIPPPLKLWVLQVSTSNDANSIESTTEAFALWQILQCLSHAH